MPFGKAFVYQAPKRKKSEVFWSGLTGPNAVLAADTNRDLIAWVKTLPAPQFGTLAPFFSIDAGGNIVTNGTKPVIRSNNGSFTATSILLIAEQATRQTLISAV
ncbi:MULTISPECIES: tail needle knob protein [Aeromonas]|uniref:Sf6-type phage tail needle knob domain-containing protein n=1 Tax=Aeromonas media TaxID=651 RepID=A0AAW5RLG7_AERME|nr:MULTISPECIES: tail needle knob protein [Aeromonas]MCV3289584.1 hypothetical protein [Aeromonas media]MDX7875409.1 tail needle knob protein [Aeromonas veronii]GJB59042.1 hypothetical protein KAM374_15780 [Aeromonas caviae]GKQ70543.1 hypothetical protein KAM371_15480 [Aeromonas caviae]GKQ84319.1 hypothetical protein KAM449_20660 [Aeromonas caviae]